MSIDVVMPQMGESVAEGTIIKWIAKVGDQVEKDDPLFEISTDKVDAEVPSPVAGVLSEIVVPEGETVEVGTKVAVIGGDVKAAGTTAPTATVSSPAASVSAEAKTEAPAAASAAPAAAPPASGGTPVLMPQMGESVAEGTVIKWLVSEGDAVGKDDPLFEISTDKVDAEVPSPAAGVITSILVQEGETVEVGARVALLAAEGAAPVVPVAVTGAPTESAAPIAPAAAPAPVAAPSPASAPGGKKIRSSPVARRLAREHGIDLSRVPGTGQGGRVSKKDVLAFIERGAGAGRAAPAAASAPAVAGAPPSTAGTPAQSIPGPVTPEGFLDPGARGIGLQPRLEFDGDGDSAIHDMTRMRHLISEHMVASRRTSAHVGAVFEVDFSRVFELRAKWKADFRSRHGANLSVTTFVIHALAPALRAWPVVNASVVNEKQIEYHRHVNLGVAVALPDGLIVPVIRKVEQKGMGELARELTDLGARARDRKLLPDDVAGSTFTLTNPGIFGALFGMPIINQPNVAILGMGGVKKRVVVVENDAIAVRPIAFFCMSYDHRIIDGAVADQFLSDVKKRIESFPEEVLA